MSKIHRRSEIDEWEVRQSIEDYSMPPRVALISYCQPKFIRETYYAPKGRHLQAVSDPAPPDEVVPETEKLGDDPFMLQGGDLHPALIATNSVYSRAMGSLKAYAARNPEVKVNLDANNGRSVALPHVPGKVSGQMRLSVVQTDHDRTHVALECYHADGTPRADRGFSLVRDEDGNSWLRPVNDFLDVSIESPYYMPLLGAAEEAIDGCFDQLGKYSKSKVTPYHGGLPELAAELDPPLLPDKPGILGHIRRYLQIDG